jgi:dihydroorotase
MLAEGGMINEGEMAVQLGLKTRPAMAEEIQVYRDLCLVEYSNGRLHFPKISSQKSIELIKIAKEKGLKVTCGVSINNLFFNENALSSFDSNFKLKPPLRTISDQIALQNAVIDGTIDLICSDHTPVDEDGKETEFDLATFGAIGIQTMISAAYEIFKEKINLEDFVSIFNSRFNKVYNLEMQKIEEGQLANLCIFEFSEHTFSEKTNKSLSANSLFFNENFNFLPKIIIHNNKISYSDSTRN